jgi:RNA polymerase sigma factor (sigma-70 family)
VKAGLDEMVIVRQELDAVEAALATLTDEQREAIALRFFSGLSAREAAEAMGKQEGTVRGLQFRAIAALRRQLEIEERQTAPRTERRSARPVRATTDG